MKRNDCPAFLKPRLRLFLSADIVGSTALKQSQVTHLRDDKQKSDTPWFSIIQGFYIEARSAFLSEWQTISELNGNLVPLGDNPRLWKTIGDEILFTKVLSDYRQLSIAINCWMRALRKVRSFLKTRDSRLDIKSTAWIAGFPVKNKDVVLSNSSQLQSGVDDYFLESGKLLNKYYEKPDADEVSIDFVGPSVDVGFRLAAHATARRFVVSVGIPYILSSAPINEENEIRLHFGGTVQLKGVFGGLPYPLFWIDMGEDNTASKLEDALTRAIHCEARDVQKYCAAFYKENASYTFRPFIDEDLEHLLTQKPDWYDVHINRLIDNFVNPASNITDDPASNITDDNDPLMLPVPKLDIDKESAAIVAHLLKTGGDDVGK